MKKHITLLLLSVISLCVSAQIPAGEYICHYRMNEPGNFLYAESGDKYFNITISDKGQVDVKMHIEVREEKTRETNYLDMTGTATGEIESGSAGFEAAGSLVFSIYERGKMDTRWNISAVFTGTVTQENGLQKVAGTIVMKMKNSSTTASFSGNGAALDIPYNLSYRLGYDYDAADRVAFPLAMQVEYTDENYVVKNAELVKVYVPGASMEYSYADKGANQGGYSYQTQDPNDRGSVFGKSYNINLFEGSPRFDIEFKEVNHTFLRMLPANASLHYITLVKVFSKKDNLLQQVTDTFRVKVRNHYKVFPLVNGEEWMRAGSEALEAGTGPRYYPLGTAFRVSLGGQFRVQFIDGTVAVIEYPKEKAYPDVHVRVSLGISADEGIDGEGNIECKLEQVAGKGAETGVKTGGKWAAIKLLLSSAKRVNTSVQLFDFFAASKVGGSKPIAVVKLRSVVGIVLGADGSFLLKNYEGHPEVVTGRGSSAVPAGQEYDAVTGTTQAITADKDFDKLKQAVSGNGGGNSGGSGSFIDKLTGEYKYYAIGGAAVVALLLLVWVAKRKK